MKVKIIFILCLITITSTINATEIELPKWFINQEPDTYVGISVPNGSEQDALVGALLQYVLSQKHMCFKIYNNGYGLIQSDYSNLQKITTFSIFDYHIELDTMISYDIAKMKLLPSNEYICQITEGTSIQQKLSLSIISKHISQSVNDTVEYSINDTVRLQFGNYFALISNKRDGWGIDQFAHNFIWLAQDLNNKERTTYFSTANDKEIEYYFPTSISTTQRDLQKHYLLGTCLAEGLIQSYISILYDELPRHSVNDRRQQKADPLIAPLTHTLHFIGIKKEQRGTNSNVVDTPQLLYYHKQ